MKHITSDYIVVGSGIAGLVFALKAASHGTVSVITKKNNSMSNTNYAQGGIASALSKNDSPDMHKKDTLKTGAGLCKEEAVDILVSQASQAIYDLVDYGVKFTKTNKKEFDLGREGGHSANRIVHAADLTGKEIERALIKKAKNNPNIKMFENHTAIDLITEHQFTKKTFHKNIHCFGVYALNEKEKVVSTFIGKVTFLASGGVGQVYKHTTNPKIATGDGLAMAYRAGATIANLEFMQFHPTTLFNPIEEDAFLISEALRGFGAIIKTKDGKSLMKNKHKMESLAPRDIVARAIDKEIKQSGVPYVCLDITHKNKNDIKKKFPNIYKKCLSIGINITKDMIPVVPAAHYMCGGIQVNLNGESTIKNLLAGGEVACTGVHGANRLASNSLLEAVVFANRSIDASIPILKQKRIKPREVLPWDDSGTVGTKEWIVLSHDRTEIRNIMWDYVGIVRTNHKLKWALRRINLISNEIENYYKRTKVNTLLVELRNIATVAKLITNSALKRKESRGLHYNTDYSKTNDRYWKRDTIIRR